MSISPEDINRRVRKSERTNPLAEELWTRHEGQVSEVEEFLGGIGYFDEPGGVVYQCEVGQPDQRPATDGECRTAQMLWDLELDIDISGDIPAQVSEKLKKLAHRLMRASKRIEYAASAGEFSEQAATRSFRVIKDGEIIGTFPTESAAVLHAMRTDGRWFEDDDEVTP